MSFRVVFEKNEDGVLVLKNGTDPQYNPDKVSIAGHRDDSGQVVDLSVQVDNMSVSGSRRDAPVYG